MRKSIILGSSIQISVFQTSHVENYQMRNSHWQMRKREFFEEEGEKAGAVQYRRPSCNLFRHQQEREPAARCCWVSARPLKTSSFLPLSPPLFPPPSPLLLLADLLSHLTQKSPTPPREFEVSFWYSSRHGRRKGEESDTYEGNRRLDKKAGDGLELRTVRIGATGESRTGSGNTSEEQRGTE